MSVERALSSIPHAIFPSADIIARLIGPGRSRPTAYRMVQRARASGQLRAPTHGWLLDVERAPLDPSHVAAVIATSVAGEGVVSHWWALELHGRSNPLD